MLSSLTCPESSTSPSCFIKPTIVRNREEARSVTNRNYRYIRAEEMLRDADNGSRSLDTFIEEVLGDRPPMEE